MRALQPSIATPRRRWPACLLLSFAGQVPHIDRGGSFMALQAELLRGSFELVATRAPDLTLRFYDELFTRYPQVEPLFSRRGRPEQAKMLEQALVAVLDHIEDAPWLSSTLRALGAKHVEYGVREEMYEWVGQCLLATLARVAGPAWNDELHTAWSEAYGAIAGLMVQGAREVA
jgi:hemoglobin-like flavoprotein